MSILDAERKAKTAKIMARRLNQIRINADGKAEIKPRFRRRKHRGQVKGAFGKQT